MINLHKKLVVANNKRGVHVHVKKGDNGIPILIIYSNDLFYLLIKFYLFFY